MEPRPRRSRDRRRSVAWIARGAAAATLALAGACAATPAARQSAAKPPAGPDTQTMPIPGLAGGPVTAAWVESPVGTTTAGGARLVVWAGNGPARVLPGALAEGCDSVDALSLSPDGRWVAASLSRNDGCGGGTTTRLTDVTTGTAVDIPAGFGGVAWSPDSQRLVLASGDPTRSSEIATTSGAVAGELPAGFDPLWSPGRDILETTYDSDEHQAIFRPDGERVAGPSGLKGALWEPGGVLATAIGTGTGTRTELHQPDGTTSTRPCDPAPLSPSGMTVAEVRTATSATPDDVEQYLAACDVGSGKVSRLSPSYSGDQLGDPGWLPDGRIVVARLGTVESVDPHSGHSQLLASGPPGTIFELLATPA